MAEKIWGDVRKVLEKYFPEIIGIVKGYYPLETSEAYYHGLRDHLIYISLSFLVDQNAKKEDYLRQSEELIPAMEREPASRVLEKLLEELEKYKALISTSDALKLMHPKAANEFVI